MDLIVEEALSNSTILREIFSLLKEEDLERVCHVSQFWRTVADPLVFSHFEIQLGKEIYIPGARRDPSNYLDGYYLIYDEYGRRRSRRESKDFIVRERARYNSKIFTRSDSNLSTLTKTLNKVLLSHKVSISLRIRLKTNEQKKSMENFLSKFGPLVVEMDFEDSVRLPLVKFSKLLLNNLPNLCKLNCTGLELREEDSTPGDGNYFNPDLPQNQHKHLRKISFSTDTPPDFKVQYFLSILKMTPYLNEIQHLPLHLTKALEIAQKGQVLKSLDYQDFEDAEEILANFQTLAQLQPKLSYFHLLEKNPYPEENGNFFGMIKPLIFSVLESSKETLEILHIPSGGLSGFETLPRMEALKTLEFGVFEDKYEGLIFPLNIFLLQIFPNVREIHFPNHDLAEILSRLPEDIIFPWGCQIKFLRVEFLCLDTLLMLQPRFPYIEELAFAGSSYQIREVLPYLAVWPFLKSLVIREKNIGPPKLDSALTGLSKEVLDTLGDSSRRGNFTHEQIQEFKDESPMRKLKELRELKLILKNNSEVRESVEKLTRPVVNEFCFKLLPHLKVTVGIRRSGKFAEAARTPLEPLAQCDNIQIEDYYLEGR